MESIPLEVAKGSTRVNKTHSLTVPFDEGFTICKSKKYYLNPSLKLVLPETLVRMYVSTVRTVELACQHVTLNYPMVQYSLFPTEITLFMVNTCVHTYVRTFMCTSSYIRTYTYIHTMHHKLLAVSVLSTSMICTKHRLSIIYECMRVFSYKYMCSCKL